MIESASDAAIAGLFLIAAFLVAVPVCSKLVGMCAEALRGWLG
jgi:hypothetical protein